ncbi:unnamed protein product [Nesidiocoris tenuis]|uniref:Uncharacterized protein n=1 Tax=Nesidiocoris tenuis TaxID=355587 RepID=A0A6H5FXW9_9HEMI|nr:unnamed protein product [Nesidiocoris tenuis]
MLASAPGVPSAVWTNSCGSSSRHCTFAALVSPLHLSRCTYLGKVVIDYPGGILILRDLFALRWRRA